MGENMSLKDLNSKIIIKLGQTIKRELTQIPFKDFFSKKLSSISKK